MPKRRGYPLFNNKTFYPRSDNQESLAIDILTNFICFSTGDAGTGKTFCAVAMALHLLKEKQVEKIILTRPVVEAGESLGALPGDMNEKVDPYMIPLYHSIAKLTSKAELENFLEKGQVEILPLAFTRGVTYENCVVILDEAQNTTQTQMKMVLTRLGENGKIIVNGDPTQIDLPNKIQSGLIDAVERLRGKNGIGVTEFSTADVVRHPIVKTVIKAYSD